jgi:transposase
MQKAPQERNQLLMFGSLDELITKENPVRLVDLIVRTIIQKGATKYGQRGQSYTGRPAYSNETLLQVYIYGYLNRIQASRRLEQETYRNIELIWLTGGMHPDHKTIADFRKDNGKLIKEFAKDFKELLKINSLIDGHSLSLDGSKVKANASKDMYSKKQTIDQLKKLEDELETYLEQMDKEDRADEATETYNDKPRESDNYQQQIEKYKKEIEVLKSRLKLIEETGRNYASATDPDCNMMKSRDGKIPGHNVQISTDNKHHFIVFESVTSQANDINQLKPALDEIREELEMNVEQIIADTGYCNLDEIETIENSSKTKCAVFHPKEQNQSPKIRFEYNIENDYYLCSQGEKLTLQRKNKKAKKSFVNIYVGRNCQNCPMKKDCTKSSEGRHISRFHNQEYRNQHRERMQTSESKGLSILRKSTIEHIFGTLKVWNGKIPFLLRGTEKVTTEIKLFSTVYNIKHLMNLFSFSEIMDMIVKYAEFCNQILFKLTFLLVKKCIEAKNLAYNLFLSNQNKYYLVFANLNNFIV